MGDAVHVSYTDPDHLRFQSYVIRIFVQDGAQFSHDSHRFFLHIWKGLFEQGPFARRVIVFENNGGCDGVPLVFFVGKFDLSDLQDVPAMVLQIKFIITVRSLIASQ
ncbi:hypothetical protein D3C81_1893330 [compost metagenome]